MSTKMMLRNVARATSARPRSIPTASRLFGSSSTSRSSSDASPSTSTSTSTSGSNPAMSFPCVDQNESRTQRLLEQRRKAQAQASTSSASSSQSDELPNLPSPPPSSSVNEPETGPEPAYANVVTGYELYYHDQPYALDYGGHLPSFHLAYETWGKLNADRSNAVLVHTGLSASSHAHSTAQNPAEGWWERFIGPGKSIDTDKYFVMCTNVLGGCYGSTGPSSLDPSDDKPYATRFPILSVFDMVRAQFHLLSSLGIEKLYASVGSSMGGMQSLAAAHLEPERVGKVVSISGTARSSPSSIAMRHAQRSGTFGEDCDVTMCVFGVTDAILCCVVAVLMADPNWKRGFYYDDLPPHTGMKLARQIATITYRSGPEWEQRFGRRRRDISSPSSSSASPPVLCPDFLIETYLDHQGEQFCLKYDANSLIYISKAMDLFSMSRESLDDLTARRSNREQVGASSCPLPTSSTPGTERKSSTFKPSTKGFISSLPSSHAYLPSLTAGLSRITHPTLIMGVQSDTLFPIEQQRELAECLKANGNEKVVYYELNQPWGHDTFLLDVSNVGGAIKGFLEGGE